MAFRKTNGIEIKGLSPTGKNNYWNELIYNANRMHKYSSLSKKFEIPAFPEKSHTTYNADFTSQSKQRKLCPAGKPSFYAKFDEERTETLRYAGNAKIQESMKH
jgi:hypothetical protein